MTVPPNRFIWDAGDIEILGRPTPKGVAADVGKAEDGAFYTDETGVHPIRNADGYSPSLAGEKERERGGTRSGGGSGGPGPTPAPEPAPTDPLARPNASWTGPEARAKLAELEAQLKDHAAEHEKASFARVAAANGAFDDWFKDHPNESPPAHLNAELDAAIKEHVASLEDSKYAALDLLVQAREQVVYQREKDDPAVDAFRTSITWDNYPSKGTVRDPEGGVAKTLHDQAAREYARMLTPDLIKSAETVTVHRMDGKEDRGGRGRAYYSPSRTAVVLSRGGHSAAPDTVIHELGHHLETRNTDIQAARADWAGKQTAGETLRRLSTLMNNPGYRSNEVARADKFPNAYWGKVYLGQPHLSEVISMGLEHLYRDPVGLAKNHPAAFDFIYGIARGSASKR